MHADGDIPGFAFGLEPLASGGNAGMLVAEVATVGASLQCICNCRADSGGRAAGGTVGARTDVDRHVFVIVRASVHSGGSAAAGAVGGPSVGLSFLISCVLDISGGKALGSSCVHFVTLDGGIDDVGAHVIATGDDTSVVTLVVLCAFEAASMMGPNTRGSAGFDTFSSI